MDSMGKWIFQKLSFGDSPVPSGDSRFPPLKGLGDSLHDLLCTELRQQRDRGGANRGWWGGEPWEEPMTPGDVKLLWCRGKWITRKTSSGSFGRMIEGEKRPCFLLLRLLTYIQ